MLLSMYLSAMWKTRPTKLSEHYDFSFGTILMRWKVKLENDDQSITWISGIDMRVDAFQRKRAE